MVWKNRPNSVTIEYNNRIWKPGQLWTQTTTLRTICNQKRTNMSHRLLVNRREPCREIGWAQFFQMWDLRGQNGLGKANGFRKKPNKALLICNLLLINWSRQRYACNVFHRFMYKFWYAVKDAYLRSCHGGFMCCVWGEEWWSQDVILCSRAGKGPPSPSLLRNNLGWSQPSSLTPCGYFTVIYREGSFGLSGCKGDSPSPHLPSGLSGAQTPYN